jgi:hypothetical protein
MLLSARLQSTKRSRSTLSTKPMSELGVRRGVVKIEQTIGASQLRFAPMSLPAWYLHKVDQCARLAENAAEPSHRRRFESKRKAWLRILADEIRADEATMRAVLALADQ